MTGRGRAALPTRALGVLAGAVLMTCLVLPLTAQEASACDVSIGYQPRIDINKPNLGLSTKPCSTRTSVAGVAVVALLAIGTLAAAGAVTFRRGAANLGPSAPDQALNAYLNATGMAPPATRAPGHG